MLARLLIQTATWLLVQGALLFWPAGTLAWPAGWAFLGIMGGGGLAIGLWLRRHDPGLLVERMRLPLHGGQAAVDAALFGAIFLLWCGWCVLMAWDARRGGFGAMPAALQAVGGLLLLGSMVGAWRALAANSYASITVRLQQEREHRLVDTGAYAWVRHPMYGAMLPAFLGVPLLLGSWWGLAGVPFFAVLLVLRTRREEALLLAGLPGYADYMRRVPHRFIPGLW